ncbi:MULTISPECIES: STAS domain-containing protein [unclassified Parvimonas]|jgi:anti-anti-sigma factor|uniref:STAS domain-containing protein n=1 Tax=unclassified Parvimonas TaxID=1151464 RepID=UPI001CAC2716|nr:MULTISPECIES: STAS domain-containing protein [unclassified Parvimonas]MBF1294989.1 STAS domain-containing protein [Parvimonas sp.]MBF1299721.1 STAS domain-containing protein [Parvimonas sp.]MEB3012563.1 STAS domain-containing protein [Parvimonas sp. D2]MEB3025376.1 STAS domain-containing protein [Parvimonas sp. M13]MEB3073568.1 STAS domain-containing protein [Parvimonas sp. C2]
MELKVDLRQEGEKLFVDLQGDLDINSNKEFKEKVNSVQGVKKITVNCENLSYIDSTGLGAFISIYKHIKEKGEKLVITGLKPHIKKIFLITDLDKVFEIEG